MKTYYWRGKKNFGDLLTPLLINHFCHLPTEWVSPEDSHLVMVGSLLEHLPWTYRGVIAGCGVLHEGSDLAFPYANILAVRGPLTASKIKYRQSIKVFADPGLIADELIPNQDKEYNLGIIPHWSDKTLEVNPLFLKYDPKIIRVTDDPLIVIAQIAKCKKIVSSSLHGIILADAFGIPRRIEMPPRALTHSHQEGGYFKWLDYSASIEVKFQVGITQEVDRYKIEEKQNELFDVFQEIKSLFS